MRNDHKNNSTPMIHDDNMMINARNDDGQLVTFGPYCLRVTTSGAIQYGVPTIVDRFEFSCDSCAQNPKSATHSNNVSIMNVTIINVNVIIAMNLINTVTNHQSS